MLEGRFVVPSKQLNFSSGPNQHSLGRFLSKMILRQSKYDGTAPMVARELLGCFLVRKSEDMTIKAMIVETEAYAGFDDKASHASRGLTQRNAVMFGKPGIFYVYFTYGMHHLLNVVTGKPGYPAAVLIRAAELKASGRRADAADQRSRMDGPARLTKALGIDKRFNGKPAFTKRYGLWIESGDAIKKADVVSAKRIGVDYAGECKDWLWRFYIKGNPCVSRK